MRDMDLPNLFIIGAPKCGTTSVFRWLADHPEISRSKTKEPNFFLGDELNYLKIYPNHKVSEISEYLSLFESVNSLTRVKMEGSVHYLYSEPALDFISAITPKPKLIVMLRNPADRIWSHFHYIKQQAKSQISIDFPTYIDKILGANNEAPIRFTDEPWSQHLLQNQLRYSSYLQHLRLWRDRFPEVNIKIFLLEELPLRKRSTLLDIAEWIDVDPSFYKDYAFRSQNVAMSPVSIKVRNFLKKYPKYFPKSARNLTVRIIDRLMRFSKDKLSQVDNRAHDHGALVQLEEFFSVENKQLQSEFKLDLSCWRK